MYRVFLVFHSNISKGVGLCGFEMQMGQTSQFLRVPVFEGARNEQLCEDVEQVVEGLGLESGGELRLDDEDEDAVDNDDGRDEGEVERPQAEARVVLVALRSDPDVFELRPASIDVVEDFRRLRRHEPHLPMHQ